jgi:MFS family permease
MVLEASIAERNVKLFIAFRFLFNSRFYYPVFAVMFLDYGLTIEQFALLNVIWAFSIVVLEVPLGAIADHMGRKQMVVAASFLMVIEMSILAFIPMGDPKLIFAAFALNRILSGAAEACASGADEALAYDSLAAVDRKREWPAVLARLTRIQSIGFAIAMIVGSAVYDPHFVEKAAGLFGFHPSVDQQTTIRFPAYLTLVSALLACFVTMGMHEPAPSKDEEHGVRHTLSIIRQAAVWIYRTPAAFVLILAGLFHDSIIRLFMTIGSNFYRLIQLPEASFGLIGAAFSFIGFFIAGFSQRLAERRKPLFNFGLVAALTWVGLMGVAAAWPITGLIFAFLLGAAFSLLNFFLSHYLNAIVESKRRATVLSFKSLAINLAYGLVGLLYAGLVRGLGGGNQDQVFAQSLQWLPWYFAFTLAVLAWVAWRKLGKKTREDPSTRSARSG